MRIRVAVVAIAFILGAGGVEAAPKLPKPIDWPIVRPKVQETHKAGKRQRHNRPPWATAPVTAAPTA